MQRENLHFVRMWPKSGLVIKEKRNLRYIRAKGGGGGGKDLPKGEGDERLLRQNAAGRKVASFFPSQTTGRGGKDRAKERRNERKLIWGEEGENLPNAIRSWERKM